ncbi:PH domain-containing protein [Jannaschia sp. R86511]|uniref:PH domain-containing protein n=1 Tax=Jannaschia sp. R86511 TaxID=3093853 RepID=UPI0036D40B35
MSYETRPSRWWTVGVVTCGVLVLVAALIAAAQLDLAWAVLAASATLPGFLVMRAETRQPRRVVASLDGLDITGHRRTQRFSWNEVRGARRRDVIGFSDVDTFLELGSGELVTLPKGTPGGAVEAWRGRVDGGLPELRLPQVWCVPPQEDAMGPVQVMSLVNLIALVALNAGLHLLDFDPLYVLAGYLVVGSVVFLALPHLSRPLLTADRDGLTIRAWRRKFIPWSQVTDVRRKDRYGPEVVVELASGEQHELLGPDEDVVRGWWRLAVPEPRTTEDRPG